jgi:uncharacterized FAD-dependent dehydrogenase
MQQQYTIRLKPHEAASSSITSQAIAMAAGIAANKISGFHILKRSIDARSRQQVWINLTVQAFIDEPFTDRTVNPIPFKDVRHAQHRVVIIGAGPAGLFAALACLEKGIQPIVLERGKDVRARRRDLAALNKEGVVNPESNYCFGEGGAGTYSDGKLYTRSTKRGDINRILHLLHQFGASDSVLYDAHPHIGTNKLPHIITAMREQIIEAGGIFLFEKKVTGLIKKGDRIAAVTTADGDQIAADDFILATGHSARDIFVMLHEQGITIEAKPFALGVRIEHPQSLIDSIQYHCPVRDEHLPPASYGLVEQVNERGVFSFCMCPGGIIAPAATAPGELVVNGWSPSKRDNPYANSGMVVQVELADAIRYFDQRKWKASGIDGLSGKPLHDDPLLLMYLQQAVERKAFEAGGGKFVAPAQRMADMCANKPSSSLPKCSYLPGVTGSALNEVLPDFVYHSLQQGFQAFGRKMKGYLTNEAIVVATESRTSSPVRIPRDSDTLAHPMFQNLYPCGEGAGYAGGIVSAAMDGERVLNKIAQKKEG